MERRRVSIDLSLDKSLVSKTLCEFHEAGFRSHQLWYLSRANCPLHKRSDLEKSPIVTQWCYKRDAKRRTG